MQWIYPREPPLREGIGTRWIGDPLSRAYLALPAIAGALWGSAGVFVREFGAAGMDSAAIVLTRLIFGTVILLTVIIAMDPKLLKVRKGDIPLMALCGISLAGVNIFYTESAANADLSLAAVLLSMSPVFMVIMARMVFGERITRRKCLCIMVAVVGCILVTGFLEESREVSSWGVAAGLLSAFSYALFGLSSKRSASEGNSTLTTLFWSMLVAMIVLIPFADLGGIVSYGRQGIPEFLCMVLHGAVCAVIPNLLYMGALARINAGTVAILASTGEPVAAILFGAAIYSEIPTTLMIAGIILAIVAMVAICHPEKTES